jgi:hypothetical protein
MMGCSGRKLWRGTAGAVACVLAACSTTPELDFTPSPDTTLSADASSGDGSSPQTGDGSKPSDPGSDGGAGTDGDASSDSGTGNDGSGGYLCGASRVADCSQCASGNFLCAATGSCTSSCKTNCGGAPIECVACNGGGQPVARVCEPDNQAAACITGNTRCTCSGNNPATCFGPRQVCAGNQCTACGEPGTNDKNCTGGGKCTENGGNMATCN